MSSWVWSWYWLIPNLNFISPAEPKCFLRPVSRDWKVRAGRFHTQKECCCSVHSQSHLRGALIWQCWPHSKACRCGEGTALKGHAARSIIGLWARSRYNTAAAGNAYRVDSIKGSPTESVGDSQSLTEQPWAASKTRIWNLIDNITLCCSFRYW